MRLDVVIEWMQISQMTIGSDWVHAHEGIHVLSDNYLLVPEPLVQYVYGLLVISCREGEFSDGVKSGVVEHW